MSLMRSSMIASAATFCCRFTGLVRELVYTSLFGATGALDAFYTAFRIPNTLRDLFAEGALSQSYTSVASKTRQQDGEEAAWNLTRKIATQLTTLMLAIITIGILVSGPIMEAMYPATGKARDLTLATGLCQTMWPFIGFASLSALVMGALNICGSFGLPMLASAAFNIVSVIFGLAIGYCFDPHFGPMALYGFAIGVVLGGGAQLAVQLPKLRQAGFRWKPDWNWKDLRCKKIWFLMLPGVVASGVTQLNVLINNTFALQLESGSVTALSAAFRLWQLPVGLFGVATGMVVLPSVSRMILGEDRKLISDHIAKALRFVSFFAVPSTIALGLLGTEIVSLIFQRGEFTAGASELTGNVLASYALGLLGYAGIKVVQPVFMAVEKPWAPMIMAVIALGISVSLNYYFVNILHCNAAWLAITTSIITTLNFAAYYIYLSRLMGSSGAGTLLPGFIRIILAGLPMAAIYAIGHYYLFNGFTSWGFWPKLLSLALVGGIGGIAYLAAAWILKVPELNAFRKRFAR